MIFTRRETRLNLTILMGCFLLSFLSYFNIIGSFFLSDDFNWVHQIQTRGAFGVWTTAPDVFFRPVVSLTLFIDHAIWGLNSFGYHLTNLSFHAVCAFFVYQILSQLLNREQFQSQPVKMMPMLAALFFIIVPSHVEAVTWISARSDLVATCFCLGSFSTYLSYKNNQNKSLLIGSYILFLFALLSKESVIIYPGIIFAYEVYHYFTASQSTHTIKDIIYLPFIYTSLFPIYLILRYLGLGQLIGGYGTGVHLTLNSAIILRGLASSLRTLIPPISDSESSDWQLLFLVFIVTLLLLIIKFSGGNVFYNSLSKLLLFLIAAFFISLLPILNLVVSVQDNQGERFLYFPSVFMMMILTLVLSTILWQYRFILLMAIAALVLFWSHCLYVSNKNWEIASTISQQIVNDINAIAQTHSLFITNIPDHFNGAYIYRNGLYPATQLFCESKQIKYLPIVLFNNLIHAEDKVEVTALSSSQYQVKLIQPGTYFINPSLPIEERLETPNFKIIDFDWNTRQSFTVEIKVSHFQDQVAYYSKGHLIRVPTPIL